ncbi:hypothetical protein MAR_035784 [Mya arenaria]|uniref:Uncharacterized protein n=2 Tax=Mya arenaria TaxID=6604 RepID=A0ABY7EL47_MYAAR|nr:hypothetical protein MAR_035784 [Mya arenaria]
MPKWREGREIGDEDEEIDFTSPPSSDEGIGESNKTPKDKDNTRSINYNDFKTNVEKDSALTDLIIAFVLAGVGTVLKAIAGKVAGYIGSNCGRN